MSMLEWLTQSGRRALPFVAAMFLAYGCLAHADDVPGFRRRLWTTETGTPADIWALAQGKQGYLWLGTGSGLYRFDGFRFERLRPATGERIPSNDITALTVLDSGTLWMGFYYGGASAMQNGHLHHYGAKEGFPRGMVLAFARTGDGAIWAATEGGLARFDGTRWQTAGADWAYPTGRADWLTVSRDGTLWVTTGKSLMFLRPGQHRFEPTNQPVAKYGVVEQAPDGTLWLSDHLHGTRALPGLTASHPASVPTELPSDSDFGWSSRLLFDRYGNLWGTFVDRGGIYRVAAAARLATGRSLRAEDYTETVGRTNGLVSERAVPLLEDTQGTVWAGTNMGLASFHRNSFQTPSLIPPGTAANYAMARDAAGAVWVANGGVLFRFHGDTGDVVRRDLHDVDGMLFDRAGDLWMVGRHGLYRLHGDALSAIDWPVSPDVARANAFVIDASGELWLALTGHGLYHRHEDKWQLVAPLSSLAHETPTALAGSAHGQLWIGYTANRLVRLDGNGAHLFTESDGLHVGTITAIEATGEDVLIGGEQGLARLSQGHIASMNMADDDAFSGITGIERATDGDLWLNTAKGVVRVAASEASESFGHPDHHPAYRLLDYRDGLPGIAKQAAIASTTLVDGHQRLWFLTNQGPAWMKPIALSKDPPPPPVSIVDITVDGKHYPVDNPVRLPKGTTNLEVRYNAASLAIPDRVRFRYRLDGADADWQDAGNRREAFYANLGPGTYRFHVLTANDDGVWGAQSADIRLAIAPWFYQSIWFYALCGLLLISLVAGFFVWRMRLAEDRVHLQLTERMNERERIAREIHDTLLQGVQGLLLRLQARMADTTTLRTDDLDVAIKQARQMVVEGRNKIIALRGESPQQSELVQSILAVGEDLASIHPSVTFRMTTNGQPRQLLGNARDEIVDITREAIRNAFLHAQARHVDVHVEYGHRVLKVRVADNGRGIDDADIRSAPEAGHWGIVGMRERAERLGAKLAMRRQRPHGTQWLLSVPCRVAYRPPRFTRPYPRSKAFANMGTDKRK
ncbi:sensor histidine kinase [Dyella sp.]|uniref:sensor histidine kinase n=1 Tax=Dyella sp. TaxID=1869338 RepID=UPI002ED4FB2D